jgi:hypothetical protein
MIHSLPKANISSTSTSVQLPSSSPVDVIAGVDGDEVDVDVLVVATVGAMRHRQQQT